MYSFLTGFFMVAGGIFGMHLGLSLHTEGVHGKHGRILVYTKPCGRQADIQRESCYVRPCRGMCNRDFLSGGLLSNDDAVPPRISHQGNFSLVAGSLSLISLSFLH